MRPHDSDPSPPPHTRRLWRFWRADPEADADAEVHFHLESQIAENVAAGMTPDEARAAALRRFGDVSGISETLHRLGSRRERRVHLSDRLDRVRQDVRFALRQFARNPLFTIAAVLTMALGIGANTAIFSATYSVLLEPLPYANAGRLLDLRERWGQYGMVVASGNYAVWKREATDFAALGAAGSEFFNLTGAGEPQRLFAYTVTSDYWKTRYIPPVIGRYFGPAEDSPGAPNVAVLSEALWRSTFGGDSGIVGRAIMLNGQPYTVIGVAPAEYGFAGTRASLWVPMPPTLMNPLNHSDHELAVTGLVRAGVSNADAVAQLTRIETRLAKEYPHSYFDGGIIAKPLQSSLVGSVRPLLLLLTGAVGLVLLIACVNVANLLLARGAARAKELAIRGALGAGRSRVVAQLLAESVLLSLLGAAIGVAFAGVALHTLIRMAPAFVPRLQEATINLPALLFTLGLSLVAGLVFGLLPALRASKLDLQQALRDGTRGAGSGVRDRLRGALVVTEIAIALLLLDGAGMLLHSAIALQRVPVGFDTQNLLLATFALPRTGYPSDTAATIAFHQILDGVQAIPGVTSAALVSRAPIADGGYDCPVFPEESSGTSKGVDANQRSASPQFFSTLGIPLVRGRVFTDDDRAGTLPVAMINAGLARELFGSTDPIGRRVSSCADPAKGTAHWVTIVGVTRDIRADGPANPPRDEIYFPDGQWVQRTMTVVVRGQAPVSRFTAGIRRAVAAVDRTVPLSDVTTMDAAVADDTSSTRFSTTLFSFLGIAGLVLATVGIYGVIGYVVVQRTPEFGVRLALGAEPGALLRLVLRQGVTLAVAGVAIGTAAAYFITRLLGASLSHFVAIAPWDPLMLLVVAMLLVIVAGIASLVPAVRATRVDPLTALREG